LAGGSVISTRQVYLQAGEHSLAKLTDLFREKSAREVWIVADQDIAFRYTAREDWFPLLAFTYWHDDELEVTDILIKLDKSTALWARTK